MATYQYHISRFLPSLQQIRQVVPHEEPTVNPTKSARKMVGTTSRVEGVPVHFLTVIIPNIDRYPERESLIRKHQLMNRNVAYMALKLGGGCNRHLALTMETKNYMAHTGYMFVPLHNPTN